MSDSLQHNGIQYLRLTCPSLSPRVSSNSRPLSQWCHLTISSFCLQSFPASGSYPVSLFFPSGDQSIGTSMSTSVLPVNIQDWFPFCQCRRCRRLSFKSLCWEDSLEEEMTTHSSILAWRIPWAEEPSGLLSARSQRIRHNLVMECTHTHRKELPLKYPPEMSYPCAVRPRKDSSASAAKPQAQTWVPVTHGPSWATGGQPCIQTPEFSPLLTLCFTLILFSQPVFSKRSTRQRDLWDEMKANTMKMGEEEGDRH